MDFTQIFSQTLGNAYFSPGKQFILSAHKDRVVVRRADREGIIASWLVDSTPSATTSLLDGTKPLSKSTLGKSIHSGHSSDGWVTSVQWSPDSEYILAVMAKRGTISIFSMNEQQEDWSASIEAGAEGLVRAEWAPDSRNILCFSEWGLRVTIWSLVTGTATYIQFPKHPDRGYAFRKDGRYFALAERHKSKDMLGVYDAFDGYKLIRHVHLPTTSLSSISLSPNGNHLAVWESSVEFKLFVLNLAGQLLATFTPPDDESAPILGIRTVTWHPTGSFLVIGGWDTKIFILSTLSWTLISTLQLTAKLPQYTTFWREPLNWLQSTHNRGFLPFNRLTSHTPNTSLFINVTKPTAPTTMITNFGTTTTSGVSSGGIKSGTSFLQFSPNGSTLLALWDQSPNYVFLYHFPPPLPDEPQPTRILDPTRGFPDTGVDMKKPALFEPKLQTIIQLSSPVMSAKLSGAPELSKTSLAACTGTGAVYIWCNDRLLTEEGERGELTECVAIPSESKFSCRDVRWANDGEGVLLLDRDVFCAAFEVAD